MQHFLGVYPIHCIIETITDLIMTSTEVDSAADAAATAEPATAAITSPEQQISAVEEGIIEDLKDNGILEFMTPERAIELYKIIHSNGIPDLEWKFYGRRRPDEAQAEDKNESKCDNAEDKQLEQQSNNMSESLVQTEFDFDESFAELSTDTSTIINDSLRLKNRPEPGSEKKTNLSDIMSHLMKEKSLTEDE